jgi:hypothetical protein
MKIDKVSFIFEKDYLGRDIMVVGNFNNQHDFTYNIDGNKIEFKRAGQTIAGSGPYEAEERMMSDTFVEIKEWEIKCNKLFLMDRNGEILIKCVTEDDNPTLEGSEWSVFWVEEKPDNVQLRINNTLIRKVKVD